MSQSADSLNWGSWRTLSDNRCKAEEVQEGLLSFVGISQTQTHWICTICDHLNLAQLFEGLVIILHNHQCVLALLASFLAETNSFFDKFFKCLVVFFLSLFFFTHSWVDIARLDWLVQAFHSHSFYSHAGAASTLRTELQHPWEETKLKPATLLTLFLCPLKSNPIRGLTPKGY